MKRFLGTLGFGVAIGFVAVACSSATEAVTPVTITTTTVVPETTTTTTTILDVVTTIRQVPAEELTSSGNVTIDDVQYDFAFECFAAGAGDVLALGVGQDPQTREGTQAIVQMFFGQPFVSVLFEEGRVVELAIDAPAELFLQDGVLSGSALRFVDAADAAGLGQPLGLGTVTVECESFAPGLPDEYVAS